MAKAVVSLLSFFIALGPGVPYIAAEEPQPLAARVAASRDAVKQHFLGATLARADYAALQKEVQAASDADAKTAWDAFEPAAHRYNALRGELVGLSPAEVVERVKKLCEDFDVPAERLDELAARYRQLQATLVENGVSAKDGRLIKADGKPFTEAELNAFVARRVPKTGVETREALDAHTRDLMEVQKLAGTKDYDAAVTKLNQVLYGMGQDKQLLETGFGSLPMQTTLSMIEKARQALPAQYRAKVQAHPLDAQLLSIANKRIEVPAIQKDEQAAGKAAQAPLRTGVQLSFYAALTGFPMTKHWAEKKLYEVKGTQALATADGVSTFRYAETDPAGKPRPGFFVTFKDGSKRYESRDGYSLVTSADGSKTLEQDQKTGLVRQTEKGAELFSWQSNGKGISGHFRGVKFNASADEKLQVTADGGRLFITGKGADGKPTSRWYDKSGAMGKMLPGGLGELVLAKDSEGTLRKDIVLYPNVLAQAADGKLDLSPLKNDVNPALLEKYGAFLNHVGGLGALFDQSLRGQQGHSISDAYFRDGKLYLALGENGKATSRQLIVDVQNDGITRAFYQAGGTTFMYKIDASGQKCEQFLPDAKAQVEENRLAFNLSRRYAMQGGKWTVTENIPIALGEGPSTARLVGGAALDTLGGAAEVVFSPFQTAHHGIHAGLTSGMGHAAGVGHFADMDAIYTLRQATFNKWLGQGLENHEQIMEAYGQGLPSDADKRKEVEGFLDTKVEEYRKQRWGEAYDLHRDDKITRDERAYAAARVFGLSNLAQNYFDAGKESYRNGSVAGAVGNYAVGAFAIGGQMYVQGFGFGAAAQGIKTLAIGSRLGLTAEQVAAAAQKSQAIANGATGVALSAKEAQAVNMLKWAGRAETATFLTPAVAQGGSDLVGLSRSLINGKSEQALKHLDGLIANGAAFAIPLGLGRGAQMTNDAVIKLAETRRANVPGDIQANRETPAKKPVQNPQPEPLASKNTPQDALLEEMHAKKDPAAGEVQGLMTTDAATGLPNRFATDRTADATLARLSDPFVAVMDMNNFGAVNDGLAKVYGPSAGRSTADTMLAKAAARLRGLAGEHNVKLSRYGGEEFVVLGERADVLSFLEAAKLEFKDNQAMRDMGFGEGTEVFKAVKEAASKRGKADQSIGDFTTGVAAAKGRQFAAAWHLADQALGVAKETPGGRGNSFEHGAGENGATVRVDQPLTAEQVAAQIKGKQQRDASMRDVAPGSLRDRYVAARDSMSPERFAEVKKLLFVDGLTGARTEQYMEAEAADWSVKHKDGQALMVSARGLKLINDALDHARGDDYLRMLGKIVTETVRRRQEKGGKVEDAVRYQSKDFLLFGEDLAPIRAEIEVAMSKALAGDGVFTPTERAKIKDLAHKRGEDPSQAGTLRVVGTDILKSSGGNGDIPGTFNRLIDLSASAKDTEGPPPPKLVNTANK